MIIELTNDVLVNLDNVTTIGIDSADTRAVEICYTGGTKTRLTFAHITAAEEWFAKLVERIYQVEGVEQ